MSAFSLEHYYNEIERKVLNAGKPERAAQQAKYMKEQFEFAGLMAKEWLGLIKAHYKTYGYPPDNQIIEFSEKCYRSAYREMHYIGLETVQRRLKHQPISFIEQLKWLIVTNSWWDTVDWLAGLVGHHLEKHPSLQLNTTDDWNRSDNIWLIRVSIIFQLKYKERTRFRPSQEIYISP